MKKELGTKPTQKIPTDDDFINAFSGEPEQEKVIEHIKLFNDLREGRKEFKNVTVSKTYKNINFYVTTDIGDKISINLYLRPKIQDKRLDFWGTKKIDKQVRKTIREGIPEAEILKEMTTNFGMIAKWPLKAYSTEKFEKLLRKLAEI